MKALVDRIAAEQGRLDVLVNDIWGGETLFDWDAPVWEHDLDKDCGCSASPWRRTRSPATTPCRCCCATPADSSSR